MSSFNLLLGFTILTWIIIYCYDIFIEINIYHKYIVANCFFLKYYQTDWVRNDDTTFSFTGTAEVLVKANKYTRLELESLYPNIELLLKNAALENSNSVTDNIINNDDNNHQSNIITSLHLPFNTNISIDEPVGELFYFFETPPFELSSSPYHNPHKCFFHPITKDVSTSRTILPLFYLITMITITIALTIPLIIFPSQRKKFNNSIPKVFLVYILIHFLSLAFIESNDYTLKELAQDVFQRCLFIAAIDIFYEYLSPSWIERLHFHYAVSSFAILYYSQVVSTKTIIYSANSLKTVN